MFGGDHFGAMSEAMAGLALLSKAPPRCLLPIGPAGWEKEGVEKNVEDSRWRIWTRKARNAASSTKSTPSSASAVWVRDMWTRFLRRCSAMDAFTHYVNQRYRTSFSVISLYTFAELLECYLTVIQMA